MKVATPRARRPPEKTGDKSKEGKKRKPARFRRRVSLPRPSISRPSLSKPKVPEGAGDLWFRFVTRLRAVAYWLREKAQVAWRWIKQAATAVDYWWSKRSRGTRIRIFAVAGVVVLYLIVKFLPVPGVPCEISAAKECAPSNDTIAYVPRDALLYAHLTVNSSSHQWDLAGDLHDQLPNFAALLQSDTQLSRHARWPPGRPGARGPAVGEGRPRPDRSPRPEEDDRRGLRRRRGGQREGRPVPREPLSGRQAQAGEGGRRDSQRVPDRARHRALRRRGPVRRRAGGSRRARRRVGPGAEAGGLRPGRRPVRAPGRPAGRAAISPGRESAGCSPGAPAAQPSWAPSSTTAPRPAWPPRCEPATTGWR